MKARKPRQSVEVFAHVNLGDKELHVAWHFPDSAPVHVSVGLDQARNWTRTLLAQGRRNRGAPATRNLESVQPAGATKSQKKRARVGEDIYADVLFPATARCHLEIDDDEVSP